MPKDIRSFFTSAPGKASSDGAGKTASKATASAEKQKTAKGRDASPEKKRAIDLSDEPEEEKPAAKRSRHFDSRDSKKPPAAAQKQKAPAKTASKATAAASPKGKKPATTQSPSKVAEKTGSKREDVGRAARKKAIVIASSSDDDEDDGEEESEASSEDEVPSDDSDSGDIDVDLSEEADEVMPAKKSRSGAAASKAKPPASAKKSTPAAKAAADTSAAQPSGRKMPPSLANASTAAPKEAAKPSASQASQPSPKKPASSRSAKKADKGPPEDPLAKAAQEAVDAAVRKLPAEDQLSFTVMEEGGYDARGGGDPPPPNHGQKDLPRGHPDCLAGKTFVVTGVLDSLYRSEAEDLIKRHSGRVTGSVSGRTTFLLVGQNCGNSKTRQAREKGTKLIDEDGLFSLIMATKEPKDPSPPPSAAAAPEASLAASSRPSAAAAAVSRPQAGSAAKSAAAKGKHPAGSAGSQLWVDRHKPQSSAELVGNGTVISTLRQWLKDWTKVHLQHQAPSDTKGKGMGTKQRDLTKKAVLLSGPPGIGKTSSALIITREAGYEAVEVNASDTRNKADASTTKGMGGKLANTIKELLDNSSLGGAGRKVCLVMDEVDGMSGGDRGGVQELIKAIAKSKLPIIAICNDRYNQKLRSLRNHCLELEYRKPTRQQIAKRMGEICHKEGLSVNSTTLEALAEGSNMDIRLVLGQLQMVRLRARALSYDDVKANKASGKDADMSPFEAARKLLASESERMSLGDRVDCVFQDMDLVPLLIQENYLNHRPNIARDESTRLRAIAKAADAFSMGDIVNRAVRQYGNWGLMPFAAMVGSVLPACYMRGMRESFNMYPGEPNFPRFTAWLGNNSSSTKQKRLLGELHTRMAASGGLETDRTALRTSYLPLLRNALTQPLVREEKEGIEPVIQLMQDYCIGREDLDFVLDVTKFKTQAKWGEDPFKGVPAQVKSAFTRQFNQQAQAPRCNTMVEDFKKGRKGKRGAAGAAAAEDADEEGLGGGDPEMEAQAKANKPPSQQEEEEEDELDPEVAKRKAKQLARKGITFQAKEDPKAKGGKRASGAGSRGGQGASKRGRGSAGTPRGASRGRK
ncbi:hypothetical protein WJX73_001054 [Symbiochloris irregularis]|uniref:Replication factor C subunit 1 n=1 Tax=Symbiochloris irregularis TaxID=706552 RepID=A0AAW1PHE3_9CHLO